MQNNVALKFRGRDMHHKRSQVFSTTFKRKHWILKLLQH
jgi:hypothetical protein